MKKKRPSAKRTKIITFEVIDDELYDQAMYEMDRLKRGAVEISYPIKYKKGAEATIITGADGYEHFFYPPKGAKKYWDYDGGGVEFQLGKRVNVRKIEGSIKVQLPLKSLKIGAGGKGLTIVDAKGKKYEFS